MLLPTLLALTAVVNALPARDEKALAMYGDALAAGATTMLRFGCPQAVIDRLDPLVNPGQVPSGHIHQIVGGNGFNATMTTGDVSTTASCTTCEFSEDFSNYWTANLYFKARNGTYKRVQQGSAALQFSDSFSNKIQGGTLVYYVSADPGNVKQPKPGFRMLVGDSTRRTAKNKMQSCFRCYSGPNFGGDVAAPCSGNLDTEAFPTGICKGGIRSNILFPTCWDGVNLDSPNHEDHVAYPTTGAANFLSLGGSCPSTHPVRIPQIMLEVVWDTTPFNDKSIWPADGSQPFVLSQGDSTGYGQHADYVFGWKDQVLQKAMDTAGCMGAKCGTLKTQDITTAKTCNVKKAVQEDHDGWMTTLPGTDS